MIINKRFKIVFAVVFALFLAFNGCSRNSNNGEPTVVTQDILEKIRSLSGVSVVEIVPYYGYPRAFQIDITQPVDHNNPGGPQFTQRMYLSHVDESLPMVFAPSGYAVSEQSGQELSGILQCNCLNVTHRYFDGARPEPRDWQYLTIRQAAADHHEIVTLFKTIYTGPWASAGASKSGLTPLFHKRFYPDDVRAVVAYVSPFMFGTADERYVDYLASVGTADERDRVHTFQRQLLENRDVLTDMFLSWIVGDGYTYSGDPSRGFEEKVLSYGWTYWQYRSRVTSEIPGPDASPETMLAHLNEAALIDRSSDEDVAYFAPWVYQACREIGYPAENFDHAADLLLFELETIREYFFRVHGFLVDYEPGTIEDIYRWIREEGNNIVFIYGGDDPWSGGAVELTGQTNALFYMVPGEDHGVKIDDLEQGQRDQVLAALEEWMGVDISRVQDRRILVVPPVEREFMSLRK